MDKKWMLVKFFSYFKWMLSAKLLRIFNVFIFNEACEKIDNLFLIAIFLSI